MKDAEQYIYHNNKTYVYSELDDTYYPVPTVEEYRAQVVFVKICAVVAAVAILALFINKYL